MRCTLSNRPPDLKKIKPCQEVQSQPPCSARLVSQRKGCCFSCQQRCTSNTILIVNLKNGQMFKVWYFSKAKIWTVRERIPYANACVSCVCARVFKWISDLLYYLEHQVNTLLASISSSDTPMQSGLPFQGIHTAARQVSHRLVINQITTETWHGWVVTLHVIRAINLNEKRKKKQGSFTQTQTDTHGSALV